MSDLIPILVRCNRCHKHLQASLEPGLAPHGQIVICVAPCVSCATDAVLVASDIPSDSLLRVLKRGIHAALTPPQSATRKDGEG